MAEVNDVMRGQSVAPDSNNGTPSRDETTKVAGEGQDGGIIDGSKKRKKNGGQEKATDHSDRNLSRALSWALRHAAPSLGLPISTDGYVPLRELLSCDHPRFRKKRWAEEDVRRVVANSDKQRFRLIHRRAEGEGDGGEILCVRANQGHSIPSVICDDLLKPISSNELREMQTIVHGTFLGPWEQQIKKHGLSRMRRNHIHFASGLSGGDKKIISGMRSTCQIHIYVDAGKCARDGVPFYLSENGVILTPGDAAGMLPVKYFSRAEDARTGKFLLENTERKDPKP